MKWRRQRAFTILEITIALGILAIVVVIVAQLGFQSLRDRWRNAARHQALELAANILEAARACPWESLTPQWAAEQRLPEHADQHLHEGRLIVRVEPGPEGPNIKRVTVAIHWTQDENKPARPVELTALFGPRSAPAVESKP
ncbi:MAG TPA: type II secretion system protein [Gemmataceae bacterium]|nr:type II secretion system protein [Gemmataceae bacterium]